MILEIRTMIPTWVEFLRDICLKNLRKGIKTVANKINVRLILDLYAGGMSQTQIAKTRHISKNSVSSVIRIATEKNILYEDVKDLNDDELYQLFFPEKYASEAIYQLPDMNTFIKN